MLFIPPMFATGLEGPRWLAEPKLNGQRAQFLRNGRPTLWHHGSLRLGRGEWGGRSVGLAAHFRAAVANASNVTGLLR